MSITIIRQLLYSFRDIFKKIANPNLFPAFQIESHLTTEERIILKRLAENKQIILEIGSYTGASACCFGAAITNSNSGKIFCIDTWKNDAMSEGIRDTYADFLANTKYYSQFIMPVRGFSKTVVNQILIQTETVDLLFIDGDHSYQGVKSDWESYKIFLKAGSIVIFHDWGWAEGVKRVVCDDVIPMVSSFHALPNMWWGTIKS